MELTGCTYFQCYNAVNGRSKIDYSPRADKGTKRDSGSEPTKVPGKLEDFNSVEHFLKNQLMHCLQELQQKKIAVGERVRLLKDITQMQNKLQAQELESFIKRPEAVLIIRIMRRLKPKLTDEEMKRIYLEELENIKRDLK